MGFLLLVIYIFLSFIFIINKKSFFILTIIYLILAPQVKIGGVDFDALYIVVLYFIILLLISKHKIRLPIDFKPFLILFIFNFIIYIFSTFFHHDFLSSNGISNIIGFIKIPLLTILLYNFFYEDIRNKLNYDIIFKILVIINAIGVVIQFVFGNKVRSFFENMYSTNNYDYYSSMSEKTIYNRKFGFFGSPMLLGLFSLLCLVFFLNRYKEKKDLTTLLLIFVVLFVGISSLSKTFFIGATIILLLNVFYSFNLKKKIIKNNIIKSFSIILILILLFPIFHIFYKYMNSTTSINYYIGTILNPTKSLTTRYDIGSNKILLGETYNVINENKLFGVGFQSVHNEFLGDSTYVLALHHGGYVSLLSIIIFYSYMIIISFINKKNDSFMFLIVWILSGLGMPSLFNLTMIIPFYIYYFNDYKCRKEKII